MQININSKYRYLCVLLGFLFVTGYIGFYYTVSFLPPNLNAFDAFSVSGGGGQSSMNGRANAGRDDYMAAIDTSWEALSLSLKQMHWLSSKDNAGIRTYAALASFASLLLIGSSRPRRLCHNPASAIIITTLHKKDGIK